ncbi:MAG: translocation/assembly module TamB domain-containing protein [Pseudomonadota bacterium]
MRALLAFTLILALAVPAAAQLSFLGIKNSMVQFLLDQLSTEGEFEIKAEQVEEPEDGITALTGLSIADSEGVWFTAESFDFRWSPSRLLLGEIEFQNLAMRGVRVLRPPVSSVEPATDDTEEEEPGGLTFDWPRSPLTLRVDRLAAEDVAIAEPVFGHAIAFDAEGAAQDEGDIQAVRLEITRRDAVEGVISLDYERRFDTNTLRLNLDAREGPAGLISALSGLPEDAASNARIAADGPPEDWRMTLAVALAETLDIDGEAAISYAGPLRVDAQISARPGPQLAPDLSALLGEAARLEAKAEEGPDGVILIERGFVSAPDLDLTASGSYARNTGAANLRVDLAARSGLAGAVEGVDFDGLSFIGTVTGAPGAIAADGDLTLTGLKTAPVDLAEASLAVDIRQSPAASPPPETSTDATTDASTEGSDQAPVEQLTTTTFSVAGKTLGLRLDRIGPQVLDTPAINIAGSLTGQELTLDIAELTSGILNVGVAGRADLEGPDAAVTLKIDAPEFRPVAEAYDIVMEGGLAVESTATLRNGRLDARQTTRLSAFRHELAEAEALTITGIVSNEGEETLFDLAAEATGLRLDQVRPELLGTLRHSSTGRIEGNHLTLTRSWSRSNLLELEAEGALDLETQRGGFTYGARSAELSPITALYDVALGGRASAEGEITLEGSTDPRLDGRFRLDGTVFDGTEYGDLALDHDITLGAAPAGDLALAVTRSPFGDIDLATRFRWAAPVLELAALQLQALGARAGGDVTMNAETLLAEGAVDLDIPSLTPLGRLAGTPLAGALRGDVRLVPRGTQQAVNARVTGRQLATDGARVERLDLTAAIRDALGRPNLDVTIDGANIAAGPLSLETTGITLRGALPNLAIALKAAGEFEDDPLTLQLDGQADAEGPRFGARLATLDVDLGGESLALNAPLNVTAEGQTIRVSGLDLALPRGGRLAGDITKSGQRLIGDILLEALDASLAQRFADAPVLAGRIGAEGRFDTARSADLSLSATGLRFDGVEVEGDLDLSTTLAWDGRRAAVEGAVTGGFGAPLSFTGALPLRPGLVPSVPGSGPVEGRVTWAGEIGSLWALVPAAGHILTGEMDIDLALSGDISDPQLGGAVKLAEGGYQNLDLGTILTDLTLETEAEPGGALGFLLTARDGGEGSLRSEGKVALDASGIEVATTIDRAVLVRRDEATARIDGALSVGGPLDALAVDGDIVLETVEVRLISNASANIVDLGEVIIKGQEMPEDEAGESNVSLRLDISSPGRVFVRGRGLDSTWGVDLKVRGTASDPRVTGRVERVRGRLDLIGKAFDLATGRVDFDGGKEIDPRLDIVFERETSDLTGRINIAGRASDPQLSFTSTPSLPEDEVLPRTLFGKSSQALTGSQAIQLALGIATLMDGGGGTLDQVRGAVGLDQLRVEQDEDGNAALAAGKEVAEGVFVGAKQGLTGGESKVIVEIDVFEDISIDAEVGQESGSSVGIKWKKDF